MADDTHICGECQTTFTSLEDFAFHKYSNHGLRFALKKNGFGKPRIYYPILVEAKIKSDLPKTDRKQRNTFNKKLIEAAGAKSTLDFNPENQCDRCSRKFRNQKSLQSHLKNIHQVYLCDICPHSEQVVVTGEAAIEKHIRSHLSKYQCELCDENYKSKPGLIKHYNRVHNKQDVDKDSGDDGIFKSEESAILDHENSIKPETSYLMPLPQECPATSTELIDEKTGDAQPESTEQNHNIICNVCKNLFHSTSELLNHLIHEHITLMPHQCSLCSFSCAKRIELASHMTSQHNVNLPANKRLDNIEVDPQGNLVITSDDPTCEPVSKSEDKSEQDDQDLEHKEPMSLQEDQSLKHKGNIPDNQCDMCPSIFQSKRSLTKHCRSRHGHQVFKIIGEDAVDKQILSYYTHFWKYPCNLCDKRYQTEGARSLHYFRVHEKPGIPTIKVSIPTKTTDTPLLGSPSEDLVENTESTEQSFNTICNVCKKSFRSASELLNHFYDHITLMPHQCSLCSFSCTKRIELDSHMTTQHNLTLPANEKLDSIEIDQQGNLIIRSSDQGQSSNMTGQSQEMTPDMKSEEQATFLETLALGSLKMETEEEAEHSDSTISCDVSMTEVDNTANEEKIAYELEVTDESGNRIIQEQDKHVEDYFNTCTTGVGENSMVVLGIKNEEHVAQSEQDLQDNRIGQALDQLTAVQTVMSWQPQPIVIPKDELKVAKQWACSICRRLFSCNAHLKIHLRRHTGERPFPCPKCEKAYMTKDTLDKHLVTHSDEKRFKCGECGKLFKRMSYVRVHLIHTHSKEKLYACSTCNKRFKTKSAMTLHQMIHTDLRPYRCLKCRKCFRHKFLLTRHLRRHTGVRLFKCDDCGKAFSEKSVLTRHKKRKVPCNQPPKIRTSLEKTETQSNGPSALQSNQTSALLAYVAQNINVAKEPNFKNATDAKNDASNLLLSHLAFKDKPFSIRMKISN